MNQQSLYCLAVICARAGSKGLPGKNLAEVGGKTLIRRAVEAALHSGRCSRVICSTDSDAIAAEAIRAGADAPFLRPAELAGDAVSMVDVLIHAVGEIEGPRGRAVDLVCLLQPTSPLRTAEDVRGAVDALLAEPDADAAVSLCEVVEAHPAWLRKIDRGYVRPYFPELPEPFRRQDLADQPTPYRRNGAVYVVRRDVLMQQRSLYGDRCAPWIMPADRSVDIDSAVDLAVARALCDLAD
jgi:CMP-N-acetylneuraminic acid synthetase